MHKAMPSVTRVETYPVILQSEGTDSEEEGATIFSCLRKKVRGSLAVAGSQCIGSSPPGTTATASRPAPPCPLRAEQGTLGLSSQQTSPLPDPPGMREVSRGITIRPEISSSAQAQRFCLMFSCWSASPPKIASQQDRNDPAAAANHFVCIAHLACQYCGNANEDNDSARV